jgi:nucleoid DNA-binding protein
MELKIDKYIQELLFQHNCVIIPSFGGFVGNYKGAEIHPTQHIFTAPIKQIAFNKNLIINDGLLANYIVQIEKVTYPEALEIIDKDVFKIKHLLSNGERVILNAVGYLKLDVEKNIQFNPSSQVNFDIASFGLHSFQSSAIKRGSYVNEVSKTFIDRPSVKAKRGYKKYNKFVIPALVLPVAIWLFFSPFASLLKEKMQVQTSGYFSQGSTTLYQPTDHAFKLEALKMSPLQRIETIETELPVVNTENNVAVAETTNVVSAEIQNFETTAKGSYTLIAGCFSVLENAEKQIAQLKSKNINASIVGQTKTGLYRVGCGNYNTTDEANQAMINLREQQTEVWVLKN